MKSSTRKPRSPEALADLLVLRIFRGELPAGVRLPAERQLAIELGVDRTTLRMAIKQLQRMGLVTVRHGSGVEVNDYASHGGLDALAILFSRADLPLEGTFIVEALDFWLEIFTTIGAKAFVRMSLPEVRVAEKLLDRAASAADDEHFAKVVVELADMLARSSGSVLFQMLHNSTRPLVDCMARLLPGTANVPAWLRATRLLLRTALVARAGEGVVRAGLHTALRTLTSGLRQRLLTTGPKTRASRARAGPNSLW